LARYAVSLAVPWGGPPGWPWATLAVNLAGALALGLLLGALAGGGDSPRAQGARLALGPGFLGGFTTYSAFAVEVVLLARAAAPLSAASYAAFAAVGGLAAAWLGTKLAGSTVRTEP
jgi:CrcB protein